MLNIAYESISKVRSKKKYRFSAWDEELMSKSGQDLGWFRLGSSQN